MRYLVVGSSAGLGRALSEALASAGHDLLLVAGDERDLRVQAADLSLRFGRDVGHVACRIAPGIPWRRLLEECVASTDLDGVLFPIGFADDADHIGLARDRVDTLLEVNFSAVVDIVSLCLPGLRAKGNGTVVGFGSVAAIRGRSSNVAYAAAKRALASYFESLRHACAGTGILIQFYELGYLETPRIFGTNTLFPKADPSVVAADVVRNLRRDIGFRFLPRAWGLVASVVRRIPWFLFRRLRF